MKNSSQQLNKPTAIIILVVIVGIILAGGVLLLKNKQTTLNSNNDINISNNTEGILFSGNIDTSDWELLLFLSSDFNFYLKTPAGWKVSILNSPDYIYEGAPMVWLNSDYEFLDGHKSFSIRYYHDTGDSLDTWVKKKVNELESARVMKASQRSIDINGLETIEVCINGTVSGTLAPSCYNYFHVDDFIIEMETESYTGPFEDVKKYSHALAANFYWLDFSPDNWSTYYSFNGGWSLKYPNQRLPLQTTEILSYTSFGKEMASDYFLVNIVFGYNGGVEKYWLEKARGFEQATIKPPTDLYIDGQKCLYTNYENNYYQGMMNTSEVYCCLDGKIFEFIIGSGKGKTIYNDAFTMLSTVDFHQGNKIDDTHSLYKDEEGAFQIIYPNTYHLSQEAMPDQPYIGFHLTDEFSMRTMGFSVSYQITDKTIEECSQDFSCLMYYINYPLYSDITFKGQPVLEYINEYEEAGQTQVSRHVVLKKDGKIYSIYIDTIKGTDNEEVDNMLESFMFL